MTRSVAIANIDSVTDLPRESGAEAVSAAVHAADAAARNAGIRIRETSTLTDLDAAYQLYAQIWRGEPPVTMGLLRALTKCGNYAAGAFSDGELVGACLAFFGPPQRTSMHSHVTGVSGAARGRSVGYALKLHQRAWAMLRGVTDISWTFDPLVRRNAYFNLVKLAASPAEYLPNFYGGMRDDINAGDDTDRLLVSWRLDAAASTVGHVRGGVDANALRIAGASVALGPTTDGRPTRGEANTPTVLVWIPDDLEQLRARDPGCAKDWRSALRDVLAPLLADGYRLDGFDRAGWYVLTRRDRSS